MVVQWYWIFLNTNIERATNIGNEKEFCESYPTSTLCPNTGVDTGRNRDIDLYDETDRVVGQPNRLVVYPQDLFHKAWVETNDKTSGKLDI